MVKKEWLSFGHKFHDRYAMGKSKWSSQHEYSPIFFQFIECVWHVMEQFPSAFEFNEKYLVFLLDAFQSALFGDFLFNNEKERSEMKVRENTLSFWPIMRTMDKIFKNPLFCPLKSPLEVDLHFSKLRFWGAFYLRFLSERSASDFACDKSSHRVCRQQSIFVKS